MSLISRSSRLHVVLHDRQQAIARGAGFDPRQGFDGAAQRGQRVLELVRDVRGEALDRVDPVVERLGHVAQGAREMADFVRAVGEVGNLLARLDAAPHALGRLGELAHRLGDRIGERQRKHQHHRRQDQEEPQQRPSLGGDDGIDVAALGREQQRAADRRRPLDRHATETIVSPAASTRTADSVCPFSASATSGSDLPLVIQSSADAALLGRRERVARLGPEPPPPGQALGLRCRSLRRAGSRAAGREGLRVEQEQTVAIVDSRARVRRRHQAMEHRADPLRVDRELDRILVVRRPARRSRSARAAAAFPDRW